MSANDNQVGGVHYGVKKYQHWDMVHEFKLDYFQAQITKYVMRWRDKNGIEDLRKANHFLEKYIELQLAEDGGPTQAYVNQDGPDHSQGQFAPARFHPDR